MVKKLILGMAVFLISTCTVLTSANAKKDKSELPPEASSGKGKKVGHVPEPVSCALVAAGGAAMIAVRRWKNRRNSKDACQNVDNTAL
ncbi:MAG: PEP-CTERM sorting domain-containing protein [wastewater metagenome]|nr:PEP-CTERM sorting domain-containing protein [Candidatus Loosdrechtia aerotolerans]